MNRRGFPIGTTIFLAIVIFTLAEIALLVWVADETSWLFAIALCLATAITGSALARRAGLSVMARAQNELASGRLPAGPLLEGVVILLAGALLITPGLITDAIGISALIPAIRRLYAKWALAWFKRHFRPVAGGPSVQSYTWTSSDAACPDPGSSRESDVLDVEFEEVDDQKRLD